MTRHPIESLAMIGGLDVPSEASEKVRGWRWRIIGPGPSLRLTLHFGEAVRAAVQAVCEKQGMENFPDSFHHSSSTERHHANWWPEDSDDDGAIDHILVYADAGIPDDVIAMLARLRYVRFRGHSFGLAASWMGAMATGGVFGPASVWQSSTPYVSPRRQTTKTGKPREDESPERQIEGELEVLGFPAPREIKLEATRWSEEGLILAEQFVQRRRHGKPPPADASVGFVRVAFAEPITGPFALGYGAHFGLGLMRPVR